jgi:cysteine desulfurase/selenocysteine lyase
MLKVEKIRADFPILKSGIIYLDNAASSLTPEPVLNKMLEFYREYRANVERGVHRLSLKATEELGRARVRIRKLINAKSETEIIFTKNATEGINTVANGLRWKRGDKVVTTLLEHHSNFIVWQRLRKLGVELEIVRPNEEGLFDIRDFEKAIDDKTRLVAITHVSNVLGVILPVEDIAKIAHEHGAEVLVDGAQSVPHMQVDVEKLGCEYLVFSGHKMLGPTGVGVLFVREGSLPSLEPPSIGGGTIERVMLDDYELSAPPARFEAGTPPIAEAIALGEAVEYLTRIGLDVIAKHERTLVEHTYNRMKELPGVELYGPDDINQRSGILAFNIRGLNPHDVAAILDNSANIMVRSGHHCAMPLHTELLKRPEGSVRASVYIYNTLQEMEKLIDTVVEITKTLGS